MEEIPSLKVLIVDDSASFRLILSAALKKIKGIEITGSAGKGKDALKMISGLRPDLITINPDNLDLEDINTLKEINRISFPPKIVLISGKSQENPLGIMENMEIGAYDILFKEEKKQGEKFFAHLTKLMQKLIEGKEERSMVKETSIPRSAPLSCQLSAIKVLTIGSSTGGPSALKAVLSRLSERFNLPILIVQHMPECFTKKLASTLDNECPFHVREAQNLDLIQKGHVYIAPGDFHMKVVKVGEDTKLILTKDPQVEYCRPSYNYLLDSIADVYKNASLNVILTGMGEDGAKGFERLKAVNAHTIAQDEASCAVYGMPRAAIETGAVDFVLPLDAISKNIEIMCNV
jgi:two-component system chemotaxis response regulator CheB